MAVDNKADHVGNHGGAYIDNDGMRKQFTIIDHDKKLKVSSSPNETDQESKDREEWMENFLKERIETVLLLPAVNISGEISGRYEHLIQRTPTAIVWNEEAVKEYLTNNLTSFLPTLLWRRTVSMVYWHHPSWQEGDMEFLRSGEWQKLIP